MKSPLNFVILCSFVILSGTFPFACERKCGVEGPLHHQPRPTVQPFLFTQHLRKKAGKSIATPAFEGFFDTLRMTIRGLDFACQLGQLLGEPLQ